MTDDIVTRLRDDYRSCECSGINHDCDRCEIEQEAADEIEDLRLDVRNLLNLIQLLKEADND